MQDRSFCHEFHPNLPRQGRRMNTNIFEKCVPYVADYSMYKRLRNLPRSTYGADVKNTKHKGKFDPKKIKFPKLLSVLPPARLYDPAPYKPSPAHFSP